MMCLSSNSSTSLVSDTDESEDDILNERDKALEYLETFMWAEGVSLRAPVMREKERCLKLALKRLLGVVKKVGYRQAESLYIKHVGDLEDLLEKEGKKRRRLEEERKKIGEEVRGIIREEIKEGIRHYESQRTEERLKEWNVNGDEEGPGCME